MKIGKNRIILAVLAIMVLSMLFSACGGNIISSGATVGTASPAGAAAEKPGETEPAQQKLDPVTLKMISPGPPQQDQELVNEAIGKYLEDSLNITLDFTQFDWGAWDERNNLIIASGEDCDLLFSAPWCGYITNAAKGAYLDLNDLILEYGQGILNSSYNWTLECGMIDGKLYAIPDYQYMAQGRGFFLQKDLVDKYGPEVNFTINAEENKIEDLEPLLKVIKQKEPDMIPAFLIPSKLLSFAGPWDRQGQFEVTALDCSASVPEFLNYYDNDFYRDCMRIAQRWWDEELVNKDIATTKEDPTQVYKGGNVFCFLEIIDVASDINMTMKTGIPTVAYPILKPIIGTGMVQGAMFSIPRQAKNPERAMMFLNEMHTDAQLINLLTYGIEGVHYVKRAGVENAIDPAPGIDPTKSPYSNQGWQFGNMELAYVFMDKPLEFPKLLADFNDNAIRTPALGFTYDSTNVKNELAALANVAAEYDPQISSGVTEAEQSGLYETFLDKLKVAGIDKVLADQNAQLNAWMEANK